MIHRWLILLALCVPVLAGAQGRISGVVWDSLRGVPLSGAFVSASGRSTLTGGDGRFALADLPRGTYAISVQHEMLDSIGLSGLRKQIVVNGSTDTVRLSVPSFAQLWSAACGAMAPPRDSGFVFGSVRAGASQQVAPGAVVRALWTDLIMVNGVPTQKGWRINVKADSTGSYVLCGVPNDVALHVTAGAPGGATGTVDLLVDKALGVRRQDFFMGAMSATGTVIGTVSDGAGRPMAGVRVVIGVVPEVRTGGDGAFRIFNVPTGTQQVEALSLGVIPVARTVDVIALDTVRVDFTMKRVQQLDSVRVVAMTVRDIRVRDIDDRKRMGFGHFRDSTEIGRFPKVLSVLQGMPSVISKNKKILFAGCQAFEPALWVDGLRVAAYPTVVAELDLIPADDVGVLEVYVRDSATPMQYLTGGRRNSPACGGAIVVWTKRALR